MENESVRLHVLVDGRVQGVGFRYFVQEIANSLNLTGWVRNTDEGKVEVTAEGSRQLLEKLLIALQRGPHMAYVSEVKETWSTATGEFTYFTITF